MSNLNSLLESSASGDRLIESKNREIVKLRLENDEINSNFEVVGSL